MARLDLSGDGLIDVGFDPRDPRYPFHPRASWPLPMEQSNSQPGSSRRATTTPLQTSAHAFSAADNSSNLLSEWSLQQASQIPYPHNPTSLDAHLTGAYGATFQTSPIEYIPTSQSQLDSGLASFMPLGGQPDNLQWNWEDFQNDLMGFNNTGLPAGGLTTGSLADSSPTDTYLEVRSLTSSNSDNGWASIDYQSLDPFRDAGAAIFNPGETLHIRTNSESSQSDIFHHSRNSFDSFEEIPYPLTSPESDGHLELGCHIHQQASISPSAAVEPMPIRTLTAPMRTPPSHGVSSPPKRQARKSPIAKATKSVIRRTTQTTKKDTEKRVGRRRGPLLPEQRKQASEIRKLRACLRCKFLKKTCDKGEPCAGCQPAHARLWQVPCTRIDIKDVAYFMKDYKADYERHVSLGFSVDNIKGFASEERVLYITHGYGFVLPVAAREVYVKDESCFDLDWIETDHEMPLDFLVATAKLSAGMEGISSSLLSEYLDQHIDHRFEEWVDEYFEGTPFLTEILKTAHRYYVKERLPVIRKALKLVLAYNLTQHVTLVEGLAEDERLDGQIIDEYSKYNGKTAAPVMINFQVKTALANMWRELQKDILEELSSLYSSVYSGEKLKHWPTIFLLAAILLAVWEEMQFDCHYRVADGGAAEKFCKEMETIPVGVIVGLFSAISQKLPAFSEWDTRKHHHLLNSNRAVCDAMTEVREHIAVHEDYLKSRSTACFDRQDFDCLSNKFLSKLVIRAN